MSSKRYVFKTTPDPHQLAALKEALKKGRYGIFFQQRVGKTKVAIDFCGAKSLGGFKKVLIVSPLSVRTEWIAQLDIHLPVRYDVELYPKNIPTRDKIIAKYKDPEKLTFLIINYDILRNEQARLLKWAPDTIIFDESHLIKNHASNRSKASYKLAKAAQFVLLLTGTPIPKKWYDIYGQFRALDDRIFGANWSKFKNKYAVMGGYMGKEIIKCSDYDAISDIMGKHSIRVLREDVFDEPEIENVTIPIKLELKAQKVYDELKKQYVAELSVGTVTADMAITRLMRLQQVCGGFVKLDEGGMIHISNAKLDVLVDLVNTKHEGGEQVVIFHRYRAEGEAIVERLRERGMEVGEFNGGISEVDRLVARDLFQEGNLDAIVIQISTGAMGISLDKAHINIFYSMDFSLANYLQARDRVMGRNQKSDVTNYFLAVDKTVDNKIMKTIQNDEDVASMVADKWRWLLD